MLSVHDVIEPCSSKKVSTMSLNSTIRRFKILAARLGYKARLLDLGYCQPRLYLNENYKEMPMHLMYVQIKNENDAALITKEECIRILTYIYRDVYGESFGDIPEENVKYREYLERLLNEQISNLPVQAKELK